MEKATQELKGILKMSSSNNKQRERQPRNKAAMSRFSRAQRRTVSAPRRGPSARNPRARTKGTERGNRASHSCKKRPLIRESDCAHHRRTGDTDRTEFRAR
ncbi:hypothetical protein MRX96_024534 [Rhipicephalus microplus]